ncbi:MAG: GTPase [Clostridia bacterium]|nr:GTPase [Clostridia bacterium]
MNYSESNIERIKAIANECADIADKYKGDFKFLDEYSEKLKDTVSVLLNADRPKLMVCGIYNAGKSTLINVLCRKKVAETGDHPLTSVIDEYQVKAKDYILVDSPGVDAPIEHERITDENVKKCHALMFVVSSKNFESVANYKKLIEWMRYEKPLIIVINDRSSSKDIESEEIIRIREKIVSNLKEAGYDTSKKYSIIPINAKRAEQTVFEGKSEELYNLSNVNRLEELIDSTMRSGYTMILAPIGELQRLLDNLEGDLNAASVGNEDDELRERIRKIKDEQNRIINNLTLKIKSEFDTRKEDIIRIYMSAQSQDELDSGVSRVMDSVINNVNSDYKEQIRSLAGTVNTNLSEKYGIQMDADGNLQYDNQSIPLEDILKTAYDNIDDSTDFGTVMKSTVGGALGGAAVGSAVAGMLATGAAETVAASLTGTAITTALGGAGGATAAGIPFGPIGIVAGAVLGFVGGLLTSRKKREAQERELEARIQEENRRRQEAIDAMYKKAQVEVGTMMSNAANTASEKVSEMFSATVSQLDTILNEKLSANDKKNADIDNIRKRVTVLKAELNSIKSNLQ